jgi:hypothetical protein
LIDDSSDLSADQLGNAGTYALWQPSLSAFNAPARAAAIPLNETCEQRRDPLTSTK